MTPPFSEPTVTVEPGSRVTFSGTAADDEGLKNVDLPAQQLDRASARQRLHLGHRQLGHLPDPPVDISGSVYNWSWTTPFDLTPGSYELHRRGHRRRGPDHVVDNQGRLSLSAQHPGDGPPSTTMAFTAPTDESLTVNLVGTAADETGVASVRVTLQDRAPVAICRPTAPCRRPSPTGRRPSPPPVPPRPLVAASDHPAGWGDWRFSVVAWDTRTQQDASAASVGYKMYPGDGTRALSETLGQPQTGATFDAGRIVVTGRAEDARDQYVGIGEVEVAVVNGAGQYMSSSGTFTSTSASYRTAFLDSPGSVGSNYSYTTPVIRPGHTASGYGRSTCTTRSARSGSPPTSW